MIYSDFYITRKFKIEILPTDSINQSNDVLQACDRLISVFRPVGGSVAVESFKLSFLDELKNRYEVDTQNIDDLLFETITAFGVSLSNPPADFTPDDAIELVVAYIYKDQATVVKVGSIGVKRRSSSKFIEIFKEDSAPLGPGRDTNILLKAFNI